MLKGIYGDQLIAEKNDRVSSTTTLTMKLSDYYRPHMREKSEELCKLYYAFSGVLSGDLKKGGVFSKLVSVSQEAFFWTVLVIYEKIWRAEKERTEVPKNTYVTRKDGWSKDSVRL